MKKWIGYITDKSYEIANRKQEYGMPAVYIKRSFYTESGLAKAIIKISALGVYTLHVNRSLATDEFMAPGWCEYKKTVEYYEYDILPFLKEGENLLAFTLCDGWYASNLSDVGKNVFGSYPLKLWYEVELTYFNGRVEKVKVDGSETACDGAIRYADNQNGIKIDNRKELAEVSSYGVEGEYQPVTVYEYLKPQKASIPPIREQQRFSGRIVKQKADSIIVDFSQNIAGVTDCIVKGKCGDQVTIRYAEALDSDGELFRATLRKAKNTDTYILRGDKEERFFPRHVFHGFRYAEIEYSKGVELLQTDGVALSSDIQRTGYFESSDGLINQIYSNILWGQRDNFLSVPTDCPQRDERLGWTGDAQIFCKTAMYNYDCKAFYEKYLRDMRDSADLYGRGVPLTIPFVFMGVCDNYIGWLGWSDAIVVIPYTHYLMYGDKEILIKTLPYMKNYLAYIFEKSKNFIVEVDSFGDWLSVMEETDKTVYNTAYFAYSAYLLSRICAILNDEDVEKYETLFENIKRSFQNAFVDGDGKIKSDTQAAYVLAYKFGLIDKENTKKHLVRKIEEYNYHLTTGFHGTKYLLPTLCEIGRADIAYRLIQNKTYPSWGYMVENGATTLWERWDSYIQGVGYNKHGMNSLNHYSLGACGEWLYSHVLGINPIEAQAGFQAVLIKPYFSDAVRSVKGTYATPKGVISVEKTLQDGQIFYTVTAAEEIELIFSFENEILSHTENGNSHQFVLKA